MLSNILEDDDAFNENYNTSVSTTSRKDIKALSIINVSGES